MKWIGQHIYDLVAKFRGADGSSVTIDSNSNIPLKIYQPVVDASPGIRIGASDTEMLQIRSFYYNGTQTLQTVFFNTSTESATANFGMFRFQVDDTHILDLDDGGINFQANKGISINGTDILTDSSGTATLSNIDALDATTVATLNAALTAGDITGVTAGTGLSGGGTSGAVTLNVDASQTQITAVGTIATGVWNGTAINKTYIDPDQRNITGVGTLAVGVWNGTAVASAYLDADTAHLSGTQSFTGTKTFDNTISGAIDGNAATATTLATTRAIGGVNFNGSAAIDLPGVNAAGNQSTSGLAATATLAADATTLATPRAINGVDFDGSAAITIPTPRVWGAYIKLLPIDFMPNDDGGTSKGITLNDSGTTGMKPGVAAMELVAIADIPEGFTATHVDIYDNSHDLAINVFEMNIGASGMAARGSGNANTTLDITDVESTVTNFLAIRVETTGTSERVFGGRITITPNS